MIKPLSISDPALSALVRELRACCDCPEIGLAAFSGASSWRDCEDRLTGLVASSTSSNALSVAHDARRAPYLQDPSGEERRGLLLSLSDEGDRLAAAWARVEEGSPLMGLGIDLCAANRFEARPGRRNRAKLLLTERERALAPSLWPDNLPLAHATLFAAKEAAFKATAAPLRRWYEKHDDELRYGVRHYVMDEPLLMSGTGRDGTAQRALEAMGIARIEVRYAQLDGMAIVVACALAY